MDRRRIRPAKALRREPVGAPFSARPFEGLSKRLQLKVVTLILQAQKKTTLEPKAKREDAIRKHAVGSIKIFGLLFGWLSVRTFP